MGHFTYPDPAPFWSGVQGWFDYADVYAEFAGRAADGDVFVEIGCFLGRSACCFGEQIKASGKRLTVLCVDVWPAQYDFRDGKGGGQLVEAPFETFKANVRQAGLSTILVPIHASSVWAATFVRDNLAAVFIDGDHEYESCKADIAAWLPKVRGGGILAGHDFSDTFPGVERAVREAFGDKFRRMGQCWLHDKP